MFSNSGGDDGGGDATTSDDDGDGGGGSSGNSDDDGGDGGGGTNIAQPQRHLPSHSERPSLHRLHATEPARSELDRAIPRMTLRC